MGELLGIVLMLFFAFSEEVNQLKDEIPVVVKLGFWEPGSCPYVRFILVAHTSLFVLGLDEEKKNWFCHICLCAL